MSGGIRTTVPALPKGMAKEKGCQACGQKGKLVFIRGVWVCPPCKSDEQSLEALMGWTQ